MTHPPCDTPWSAMAHIAIALNLPRELLYSGGSACLNTYTCFTCLYAQQVHQHPISTYISRSLNMFEHTQLDFLPATNLTRTISTSSSLVDAAWSTDDAVAVAMPALGVWLADLRHLNSIVRLVRPDSWQLYTYLCTHFVITINYIILDTFIYTLMYGYFHSRCTAV